MVDKIHIEILIELSRSTFLRVRAGSFKYNSAGLKF